MKRHIDHLTQCTEQSPVVTDATSEDSTVQDNCQYPDFEQPTPEAAENEPQFQTDSVRHSLLSLTLLPDALLSLTPCCR